MCLQICWRRGNYIGRSPRFLAAVLCGSTFSLHTLKLVTILLSFLALLLSVCVGGIELAGYASLKEREVEPRKMNIKKGVGLFQNIPSTSVRKPSEKICIGKSKCTVIKRAELKNIIMAASRNWPFLKLIIILWHFHFSAARTYYKNEGLLHNSDQLQTYLFLLYL